MDTRLERACRAMCAAANPRLDPDALTPAPRGQVGMMPKWRLYEHLARAALDASGVDELTAALKRARSALDTIANGFADPEEIYSEPEEFGGTDDGAETLIMVYENIQGSAARALADIDAAIARTQEGL